MRSFAIIFYLMMIVIISVGQRKSNITMQENENETEQTTISSKSLFQSSDSLGLVKLSENQLPTNNFIINF